MTTTAPADVVEPLVAMAELDDVGLVLGDVSRGTPVRTAAGVVAAVEDIPAGHKVAVRPVAAGAAVHKYGEVIGRARQDIAPGAHVHLHNLGVGEHTAGGGGFRGAPVAWSPPAAPTREHFLGYRRADGRAATRNYIAVLPTVNCSATVARMVAQAANARHAGVAGLDGVIALTHGLGCGLAEGTAGDDILRRTLRGYAGHANIAAVLTISLGCEVNQPEHVFGADVPAETLGIQDLGGTAATVNAALDRIAAMVPGVAALRREPIAVSDLVLGLQCGGSDAYSGLTANPTLGVAADLLVAAGGRVILGETPEIYGAEHLLRDRAAAPGVGRRIDELISWWQQYTARNDAALDSNPSTGNKAGGITTIWEKSLGAVLKAGTSPLNDVVAYAEPVTARGLTFMDTPGYDPVSATGMVAGGANLLAFTTGRGSVFGSRPTPCLKISTTSRLYERMRGDMDFDAGPAMTRDDQIRYGVRLFEALVDMASGTASKSETLGFGTEEIVPWQMGAVV
ncbi:altronate dehydratase family protein [Dactylosporangium sp. AC04546]|uniref:UxaA family hydrolase n=1 Tax=Dactylosporangium sp. AC04546 TaxID=2862460 RepID=UPI001EE020E1|nr:altronate dehydratase family protein [Dactylosporangium sp. AC04546]WVK79023.1 altronate dehydratase family protein [Dactylosporangium sp. AC04546]